VRHNLRRSPRQIDARQWLHPSFTQQRPRGHNRDEREQLAELIAEMAKWAGYFETAFSSVPAWSIWSMR